MDPITAITLGSSVIQGLGGLFGARRANKAQRIAAAEERRKRAEMNRLRDIYSNIDTSNPFLNMENTMEDLTVNQQQAQFEAQQFQQSQANTLASLRQSAGGSGIAALAQSLAQQGQLAAQRSAASIGQQEAINQRMAAQQAAQIQAQERRGEIISRQQQRDQTGTLLGMAQSEVAAARRQQMLAQQAKLAAISGGVSGITGALTSGISAGAFGGGSNPTAYSGGQLETIMNPNIFGQGGVTQTYDEYEQDQYNQIMAVANQFRD